MSYKSMGLLLLGIPNDQNINFSTVFTVIKFANLHSNVAIVITKSCLSEAK